MAATTLRNRLRRIFRAPLGASPTSRRAVAPNRTQPTFFSRYGSWLPKRRRRLVVILADEQAGAALESYLETFLVTDRVVVIAPEALPEWHLNQHRARHRPAASLVGINAALRGLGPVDILLDLAMGTAEEHDITWRKLFFHLRPQGVYAVRRESIIDGLVPRTMVETSQWIGIGARHQTERRPSLRELALATGRLSVGADFLVVVKRNRHLLKVREGDATRLLSTRERQLQVRELEKRPALIFDSRARVSSHPSTEPMPNLVTTMECPPLRVRHYSGRIAMISNALLHTRYSALPDSFRHHQAKNLHNVRLVNVNADFARVPEYLRPQRRLPGNYYHLDAENSGHFGHLMTEVLGRLWGWEVAKRELPDLKAIFRLRYPNERVPTLEQRLFSAYGIASEDIVWVDEPVWLESVVAATPMWHNAAPHYVHPDLKVVWERIRRNLAAPSGGVGDRIFVSRRARNRECRNALAVEAYFAEHGFAVILPERYDLSEQAAIFADARVVAGFGGSGMFNVLYAKRLETTILLNQEAYTARNEHLFASVLGGDLHYFWSRPDIPHPPGGWSEEAYYSSWEFDFDRNRIELDSVLDGLDRPQGGAAVSVG